MWAQNKNRCLFADGSLVSSVAQAVKELMDLDIIIAGAVRVFFFFYNKKGTAAVWATHDFKKRKLELFSM